jgi:hypothetical protein
MGESGNGLSLWNDGIARDAIVDFVSRVSREGSDDYVPPEERVAVFDNDGTLWCEKPMPIQLDFILRRLSAMAEQDPSLREQQPWKAAYERDYGWLGAVVTKHYNGDDSDVGVLLGGILRAGAGRTIDDVEAQSGEFIRNTVHPTLGRRYIECGYRPMVELLGYLEVHGFSTYIASGGGRDFIRPVTQEAYGIPRERVIGSSISLKYVPDEAGGTIVHLAELDVLDDGLEKPVRIWSRIGRRPILAAGNANGDIPMLRFARHRSRLSLRLLVLHDDHEREFAYVAGAEQALEMARNEGWSIVSMRDDWATVF